jgi:hypothetical protein
MRHAEIKSLAQQFYKPFSGRAYLTADRPPPKTKEDCDCGGPNKEISPMSAEGVNDSKTRRRRSHPDGLKACLPDLDVTLDHRLFWRWRHRLLLGLLAGRFAPDRDLLDFHFVVRLWRGFQHPQEYFVFASLRG